MSEVVSSIDALFLSAQAAGAGNQAITVSFTHLLLAFAVILTESIVAYYLEVGLADQLLVAAIRAFVQLNALGYVLGPIFASENPFFVLIYIFGFMVMISSYEAAARPKVTYPALLRDTITTTTASLLATGIMMLVIVMPTPWYNAQYLIPIAGMLISNSLVGNALALNGILEHLTTRKEQVEVLLAFGATKWEACWPGFTNIFRTALIPAINGLNIIGIVSIPGMMTGQILGGSSPEKASRYQLVITFLISGSNFISVALIMTLAINSLFDKRGRLDEQRISKQERLKIAQVFSPNEWRKWRATKKNIGNKQQPLLHAAAGLEMQTSRSYRGDAEVVLDMQLQSTIALNKPVVGKLQLHARETMVIMGPSGIGKSTILKMVCDLQDQGNSRMSLLNEELQNFEATEWRRDVLYLHQSKAPLPDSPSDLLASIAKFRCNQKLSQRLCDKAFLVQLLEGLGLSEQFLGRPWNELSGGEAQRVMIAIGLATKPRVILLDEPTSALDEASKRFVEDAVRRADCCVLWVTHDEQQAERVGDSVLKIIETSAP